MRTINKSHGQLVRAGISRMSEQKWNEMLENRRIAWDKKFANVPDKIVSKWKPLNIKQWLKYAVKNNLNSEIRKKNYLIEYKAWINSKERVSNPNYHEAEHYNRFTVDYDLDLQDSFIAFFLEVGPRPHPSMSINRINNELGYIHGNLSWSTAFEQTHNRRGYDLAQRRPKSIKHKRII